MHVNEAKSCFEHTCEEGQGGRKRRHNTTVLVAASSPVRKVMKKMSSSETLSSSIASTGLPPPAQDFVRRENSTSWEQFLVELHHLPSFLEALKVQDRRGTYICEVKPELYNGAEVEAFQRYFVSWGAASEIVVDTPLLYMLAIDGGHMKSAFGGVCLATVWRLPTSGFFLLRGPLLIRRTRRTACGSSSKCCNVSAEFNLCG